MRDLQGVKAGDMLYTQDRWRGTIRVFRVDKVTKIHAISGDNKFRLKDCRRVGTEGFDAQWAYLATPDILREYKAQRLKAKITAYVESEAFKKLPLESLTLIMESLPVARVEKEVVEAQPHG